MGHLLSEVAQTVDDVVIINGGRLRYHGSVERLGGSAEALESAFLELTAGGMAS